MTTNRANNDIISRQIKDAVNLVGIKATFDSFRHLYTMSGKGVMELSEDHETIASFMKRYIYSGLSSRDSLGFDVYHLILESKSEDGKTSVVGTIRNGREFFNLLEGDATMDFMKAIDPYDAILFFECIGDTIRREYLAWLAAHCRNADFYFDFYEAEGKNRKYVKEMCDANRRAQGILIAV